MTAEQLQDARASAWRQTGNALLTADDAAAWLRETGLALFLPRTQQIAAPAGSFAEAVLGAPSATPDAKAVSTAFELLQRLVASGDAIALNLLGIPGDRPDFIATDETLPFVFALRGDREWKRGPRGKSSPLVVEVWKLLEREGAMTAEAIKDTLGRQLTETAALRALTELWSNLRIEPVFGLDGETTEWRCLEVRREPAMQAGSAMSQGIALSALVSLYLQGAVAATSDEVEAFLSPIASRSRVRDAVRGLTATRQLGVRNLGPREHFFVEGSLPEFETEFDNAEPAEELDAPAQEALDLDLEGAVDSLLAPVAASDAMVSPPGLVIEAAEDEGEIGEGRKRFVAQRQQRAAGRDRRSFAPGSSASRSPDARPPRPKPASGGDRPFFAREPWKEDRKPRPAAGGRSGSKPPFGDKRPFVPDGEQRKPFRPRPESEPGFTKRPYSAEKAPYEKRPFQKRTGSSDARPSSPGRRGFGAASAPGERKPFGEKRPFTPRDRSSAGNSAPIGRRPFGGGARGEGRSSDGRRDGAPSRGFGGTRPPRRDAGRGPAGERPFRPAAGERPPRPAASGERRPFTPRTGEKPSAFSGPKRPFTPRDRQDRPRRTSEPSRPFRPAEARGPRTGREDRPPFGERRPFSPRQGSKPERPRRESTAGEERRPRTDREDNGAPRRSNTSDPAARKPYGDRPASPRLFRSSAEGTGAPFRSAGKPGAGAPKRFSPSAGRPARPGAPGARPEEKRPRTAKFTSSGKPRTGAVGTGRPGPRAGRPAGKPARPSEPRKPGGGPRKPGGPRKSPRRDG